MNTLWLKTLRDLWLFKGRTLLVVLAIAVGTASVGVCITSFIVLRNDLREGYAATHPAHAVLDTTPFAESLAGEVAALPEVAEAEARQIVPARLMIGGEDRPLQLWVIPDFAAVRVGRLAAQPGALVPPPPGTILLERSAAGPLTVAQGDAVTLRTSDGDTFPLQVAGFIHDMAVAPTTVQPWVYGYITDETAARLGLPETYNQLYVTIGTRGQGPGAREERSTLEPGTWNLEPSSPRRADVEWAVTAVTDWLEAEGVVVQRANIPEPGVHLMQGNVDTGLLMIGILGGLTMLLGAFLVTNVMGAVVAQQVPQVGVLKALGARRGLVLRQYGRMVVIFGLLALLLAAPLGLLGAWFMSNDLARRLNYDIPSFGLKATTLAVQAAGALLVPALAALGPLRAAAAMTIREALSNQLRTTNDEPRMKRVERLPRTALLSLRNVARRPVRLALTVAALALAGAMFMATFGLRLGLYEAIEILVGEFPYDAQVDVVEPQPVQRLLRAADEVEAELFGRATTDFTDSTDLAATQSVDSAKSVVSSSPMRAEAWGVADARRVYPDGRLGTSFTLYGVPPTTQIAPFAEKAGRWLYEEGARGQGPGAGEERPALEPGTGNLAPSLYINYETEKLTERPGPGDELALRLNGVQERAARLVGISLRPFEPAAYMPYDQWERATGQRGRASRLVVYLAERPPTADGRPRPDSATVAAALTARLEAAGIAVARTETAESYRAGYRAQFDTLVLLIMALAGLTALVGGLGLGNTMALNVLERSREIGVLRALGAKRPLLRRLVLAEGLLIALGSVALAVPLAVPLTLALDRIMGNALLGSPLTFRFAWGAAGAWLALVVVIAVVACWLPAERAARMTVREALAWE